MKSKIVTALLVACALSVTACKSAEVRELENDQAKPCQIRWYDYATGQNGASETMPKAAAVERLRSIKPLPGFGKQQTDHWLYCEE